MKKGDMSMTVIIGAVIALLILVIISVMIFKSGGKLATGTSCESIHSDALCIPQEESCKDYSDANGNSLHNNPAGSCAEGYKCCTPLY